MAFPTLCRNVRFGRISYFNHSAFFDTKYCWFLLASNHICKNPPPTGGTLGQISLDALRELISAQKELQNNSYEVMIILMKLKTKTD
jgi:hypothetical protein